MRTFRVWVRNKYWDLLDYVEGLNYDSKMRLAIYTIYALVGVHVFRIALDY